VSNEDDMSDDEISQRFGLAAASIPASGRALDDDYIRSSLRAIKLAQAKQAEVESERRGAAKTQSRLVTIFGALFTASVIAGFAWVWNANTTNAAQEVELGVLSTNPPATHGHVELAHEGAARDQRISALEASYAAINRRLDRMEEEARRRHEETLEALRGRRGRR